MSSRRERERERERERARARERERERDSERETERQREREREREIENVSLKHRALASAVHRRSVVSDVSVVAGCSADSPRLHTWCHP